MRPCLSLSLSFSLHGFTPGLPWSANYENLVWLAVLVRFPVRRAPRYDFSFFFFFFFLYLQEEDFRRENYILENMKKDESAFKGECIGKGNAFKKKKYRNDAYRAEFIHFQGRIYNNLQRG